MKAALRDALDAFTADHRYKGKGPLCVALVVTEHARKMGLPFNPEDLITERGGQVLGLGKRAVQAILKRHDVKRVLAAEGGRTSRGSLGNMREYVEFLNELHSRNLVDLDTIEQFWIGKVQDFFAGKPFKIKLDVSRSLRTVIRDVIAQALDRQKVSQGTYYAGAVLQHLVGAKLECALAPDHVEHNSFSTADAPSQRVGDFLIGDVAIYVTTSPGEAVIERCRENLNDGYRPILVTLERRLAVAEALAENQCLDDRIDLFEIEQFLALNLYEIGRFALEGRKLAVAELVKQYNKIIEDVETDPSLQIEFRR